MSGAMGPEWFRRNGLPMPSSFPTPSEVKEEGQQLAQGILFEHAKLRGIVDRHEELIRKRWMKKNKKEQSVILLTAWPNIPPCHRPDFEALRREEAEDRSDTKFEDWFKWSIINLEDLTQKRSFLNFLASRARNHPGIFAQSDFQRTKLGRGVGAIHPPFLNGYTMFLEANAFKPYGSIISWGDDPEVEDLIIAGRGFYPGHGLMVMEIQEKILKFLVKCCVLILHDFYESGSLLSSSFPVKEPLPYLTAVSTDYPTMISMTIEEQYRRPLDLDFRKLRALICAKRSEAEDHIWALREDPGYFSETIMDWSEHRKERLLDTSGKVHPVSPDFPQNHVLFWERVIAHMIASSYGSMINWNVLQKQLILLEDLKDKYVGAISPEKRLPGEYLRALLLFRQMLIEAQQRGMMNLEQGMPPSPPLRRLYCRLPQDPNSTVITVRRKAASTDQLLYMLEKLWDRQQVQHIGLSDILDQIDHWIKNHPQDRCRISTWVSDTLSDLGLIARAQSELEHYQPWAAGMEFELEKVGEEIINTASAQFNIRTTIDSNMKFVATGLAKYGRPVDLAERRFYYPSDKRRTRENVEAMRLAEQNLDGFWSKVDEKFKLKMKKSLHEMVHDHVFGMTMSQLTLHIQRVSSPLQSSFLARSGIPSDLYEHIITESSEERSLERTPEWIEPAKTPKNDNKKTPTEPLHHSMSQLGLEIEVPSSKPPFPSPKHKLKTKGTPTTFPLSSAPSLPSLSSDTQPTFTLDKRAYKVFTTLFFTPNQTDTPGEVPWTDFLHAMVSTGFRPEKLYGSVWQFTPTTLDVERAINFHEPHPSPKISYVVARRFGRRLRRAYGWYSGIFTLA